MHLCSLSIQLPLDSYITKCSLSLCMFPFSGISLQNVVSSEPQSCPTLWDPMDCSMPGLPVHHQLLEPVQTHVHWIGDAIQPSHPLSSPSPPAFNLAQRQGLFQWVSSSHQVASVLEFQLQHQSFQWIFRTLMLTKGNINFFYKSQSKSSEGYFIGHTYKPLVITFMLIFFFFANMTPPKAICSYFRFGVWRMLDPWPH